MPDPKQSSNPIDKETAIAYATVEVYMSTTSTPPNNNASVKEALDHLGKVTTPLVSDLLCIAEKGAAEAVHALQRAQASTSEIVNAAINVGSAHADLLASTLKRGNN